MTQAPEFPHDRLRDEVRLLGALLGEVIRDEGLQDNAARVGAFLLDGLREIQSRHPGIGQVRGRGLFIGAGALLATSSRN